MFFTIEQLELIRRLRNTGITSDQINKAFNELEKIDISSGVVFQSNNNNTKPPMPCRAPFAPLLIQHLTSNSTSTSASTPSSSPQLDRLSVQTVPVAATIRPIPMIKLADTPPPSLLPMLTTPIHNQVAMIPTPTPTQSEPPSIELLTPVPGTSNTSTSSASPISFTNDQGPPRPIRSQRTPMKEITTLDNPGELEEFMKQGEEACILDMKTFITQYSLRQTTVAMMTGVSQPYISKLLNGNHRELSLRCRKNIYSWYLNCRRHPEKLAAFLADPSSRLETNCDGELVPQRRERYVFRPILIRVLEDFFAKTPFPDLSRRVEIATTCNHVLQMDKKGVGLMPKEIVSPQVVSNWFANKRKELRRRSTDTSEVSPSNTSSAANGCSRNTDSVSLSSMSPPSRDEETGSTSSDIGSASPEPVPFDLSISADSTTPPSTIYPSTTMDIFAMAQRLAAFTNIPLQPYNPLKMPFQRFSTDGILNFPNLSLITSPPTTTDGI